MFILLIGGGATPVLAEEQRATDEAIEKMDTELSGEGAVASKPLAAVDNTDLKWTYVSGLSGIGGDRTVDWGASLNVVLFTKISDHQQSWGYEEGLSKGPRRHALLVIADYNHMPSSGMKAIGGNR